MLPCAFLMNLFARPVVLNSKPKKENISWDVTMRISLYALLVGLVLTRLYETIVVMCSAKETNNKETLMDPFRNEAPHDGILNNKQRLNLMNNPDYQQCLQMNKSMTTAEDALQWNRMCLMKYRWYSYKPKTSVLPANKTKTRRDFAINIPDRKWSKVENYDCHYYHRNAQKRYPSTCYTKSNAFNKKRHQNFWAEVRGDLMYTFDFVLYNQQNPHRRENQLWFLMYYLKTLAIAVENPALISECLLKVKETEETVDKLLTLINTKLYYMVPADPDQLTFSEITLRPRRPGALRIGPNTTTTTTTTTTEGTTTITIPQMRASDGARPEVGSLCVIL